MRASPLLRRRGRQNGCSKCARIATRHKLRSIGDGLRNKAKFLAPVASGVTLPVSYDQKLNRKTAVFGYARVSTYGQTLDAQLEQLCGAGCTAKIYREKVTGARADRRELLKLLMALAPGGVLTVTRIDRLARSTLGWFAIVKQIVDARQNSAPSRSRGPTPAPAPGG